MALLMIFVLNREELLEEVLSGFLEIGIGGATILDSTGMGRVLSQVERGDLTVQVPTVSRQLIHLERSVNRLTGGLVFTGFLISSVLLYNAGKDLPAGILIGAAGLTLIWLIFFSRGTPRRFHP